jgi:exosortase E/protease (VPEID-CTERM system)
MGASSEPVSASTSSLKSPSIRISGVDESRPAGLLASQPFPLFQRILYLAVLFTLEAIFLSTWLDTATIHRTAGLAGAVADWGPSAIRSLIAMVAVFTGFSFLRSKGALQQVFDARGQSGVAWHFLALHLLAMVAFCALSARLFVATPAATRVDLVAALWLICGGTVIAVGTFAFLPPRLCYRFVRGAGNIWIYASLAAISVNPLASAVDRLWNPAASLTFRLVRLCLQPFLHNLIANPTSKVLGTPNFKVSINPQCSGLEGAGLMLLFGVFLLWFLRDELRFPKALLLIPAGVVVLYLLNTLRIAALIVIGNAGARSVAVGGFHSQAGWIAFNVVALGLLLGVRHVPWLTRLPHQETRTDWMENPAVPYLAPFLAILAAAMISRASSGKFEWFYPLRPFAAGAALWICRRKYRELDWRAGWFAPLIGASALMIWLVLGRLTGVQPDNGIAAGLRSMAPAAAAAWLALRILAAVVTVPVAEELAFRGFLMRWIASADFPSAGMKSATPLAIAISSIAFGAMHGRNWLAGTAAGVLYAAAFLRRGRIGDAVAAHATTNALLAVWVLAYRDWSFW